MQFHPLFPIIYQVLKPIFPNCLWEGNIDNTYQSKNSNNSKDNFQDNSQDNFQDNSQNNSKKIALNFDDGPHPQNTPELLQVLEDYQIPGNFFWLGSHVNRYPEIAKAVTDSGRHWIGLHGYEHHNFPFLSADELKKSLEKTQAAIYHACGLTPAQVRDVRPPNGLFTPKTLKLFQEWNYRPVMWSVVPEDWVRPGVDTVVQRVMKSVKNGSLIILHDGIFGGEDVGAIAQILIPMLLEQGYTFVSVDDFWKSLRSASF
ncbi:MAG: polysaccharide deacetylase family protein [Cyanobacteria bacterium P01_A01_bin.45]